MENHQFHAMITSLEKKLSTALSTMKGKEIDMRSKNDEIVDLWEKNLELMRKNKEFEENEEVSKAKVASLEDKIKSLESRTMKYGKIILTNLKSKNN